MNRSAMVLVLGLFVLVACGSPKAGDACTTDNTGTCQSTTAQLACLNGTYQVVACKGPGGSPSLPKCAVGR